MNLSQYWHVSMERVHHLFCIMKGKNLKQGFCDGLPPDAEVKMSPKSGYVNAVVFFDWIKTCRKSTPPFRSTHFAY